MAFREHIAGCIISRSELPEVLGASGTNLLDDILNEDVRIKNGRQIKTAEKLIG